MRVRVAVLTDDSLSSDGLARIVATDSSWTIVGHDRHATYHPSLRAAAPDILLVDSRLEGVFALCTALRRENGPAVLLFAVADDHAWARDALLAGARGLLARTACAEDLPKALAVIAEGGIWAPRRVLAACLDVSRGTAPLPLTRPRSLEQLLSRREREVFRHAAAGLGNKAVASQLGISEATVKSHMTHIFQKLGVHGRSELAAAYHGLRPASPPLAADRPRPRVVRP